MANEPEGETVQLKVPHILIVDDNPANLDLLAEMLVPGASRCGWRTAAAAPSPRRRRSRRS